MLKEVDEFKKQETPDWAVKKGGEIDLSDVDVMTSANNAEKVVQKTVSNKPSPTPEDIDKDEAEFQEAMKVDEKPVDKSTPPVKQKSNEVNLDDYSSFIDSLGLNDAPQQKVISEEQRIKGLERQNKYQALGDAFKLIVEGAGASQGMYVDKRSPNKFMERTWQKIQELKDKEVLDQRRVEAANTISNIRNIDTKARMVNSEMGRRDMQDRQIQRQGFSANESATARDFTAKENEKNRVSREKIQEERMNRDKSNDKEFLIWKADLDVKKQKEISAARTADRKQEIESQYTAMSTYQQYLKDNGLKTQSGSNTTEMTVKGLDGKTQSFTKKEVQDLVFNYMQDIKAKPRAERTEYENGLVNEYYETIPKDAAARDIVKKIYEASSEQSDVSLWGDETESSEEIPAMYQ